MNTHAPNGIATAQDGHILRISLHCAYPWAALSLRKILQSGPKQSHPLEIVLDHRPVRVYGPQSPQASDIGEGYVQHQHCSPQ
jgi:hypothetical protein